MARHTISFAKDLYRGKSFHQKVESGKRGIPAIILSRVTYSSAVAANAAAIVTLTAHASGAHTLAINTLPAVDSYSTAQFPRGVHPRVVSFTIGTAIGAACTLSIVGKDIYDNDITDRIVHPGSATVKYGQKAFAIVSSITSEATATSSYSLGYGAIFGLPYKLTDAQDVLQVSYVATISGTVSYVGGTAVFHAGDTGTVSGSSKDTRGRFVPQTAPDGANQFTVWYYCEDTNDAHGKLVGDED